MSLPLREGVGHSWIGGDLGHAMWYKLSSDLQRLYFGPGTFEGNLYTNRTLSARVTGAVPRL